jgi:hypothetical protein
MKTFLLCLLSVTLCAQHSIGQQTKYSVSFDSAKNIQRSKNGSIVPLYLTVALGSFKDSSLYKIVITPDLKKSTLAATEYRLDYVEKPFNALDPTDSSRNAVYLILAKDALPDRARKIVLNLEVKRGDKIEDSSRNAGKIKTLVINLDETKEDTSIKSYYYLAYIGTNFDLVDGVKAKDLFFAANVFLPPTSRKSIGFYLSLYGNRTMTTTDSTPEIRRNTRMISLTDTTYRVYSKQMSLVRTSQSDNLGAYSSPLMPLWGMSDNNNQLKLYFTPSLEFVWRRTHLSSRFTDSKNLDSVTEKGHIIGAFDYSDAYESDYSEFVFNYGAGLMVIHESKDISVRVHATVGHSTTYTPLSTYLTKGDLSGNASSSSYGSIGDIYFTGRAWITEPVTGLTLQAEITNTKKYPRPFYGVTLSKALNFKNLANVFQPITAR